eukprot:jgi/Chrzof1/4154/Cz14g01030.t1
MVALCGLNEKLQSTRRGNLLLIVLPYRHVTRRRKPKRQFRLLVMWNKQRQSRQQQEQQLWHTGADLSAQTTSAAAAAAASLKAEAVVPEAQQTTAVPSFNSFAMALRNDDVGSLPQFVDAEGMLHVSAHGLEARKVMQVIQQYVAVATTQRPQQTNAQPVAGMQAAPPLHRQRQDSYENHTSPADSDGHARDSHGASSHSLGEASGAGSAAENKQHMRGTANRSSTSSSSRGGSQEQQARTQLADASDKLQGVCFHTSKYRYVESVIIGCGLAQLKTAGRLQYRHQALGVTVTRGNATFVHHQDEAEEPSNVLEYLQDAASASSSATAQHASNTEFRFAVCLTDQRITV